MNPFLLRFADGTSFLAAMMIVMAAAALPLWSRRRLVRRVCSVAMLLGVALAVLSSTPLPFVAYIFWTSLVLGAAVAINLPVEARMTRRAEAILAGVVILPTAGFLGLEASSRICPRADVRVGEEVYVIGDSLSAGTGSQMRCWPAVLADRIGMPVVNLAAPGARAKDGLSQAGGIRKDGSLVIVELGGNDVLGRYGQEQFHEHLEKLLAYLRQHGHRILMFELPLPPLYNAFARTQRELAGQYGVDLIPKWCLAHVLGGPRATIDGLHLSKAGHNHLAEIVGGLLHVEPAGSAAAGWS